MTRLNHHFVGAKLIIALFLFGCGAFQNPNDKEYRQCPSLEHCVATNYVDPSDDKERIDQLNVIKRQFDYVSTGDEASVYMKAILLITIDLIYESQGNTNQNNFPLKKQRCAVDRLIDAHKNRNGTDLACWLIKVHEANSALLH